MQNDIYNVERLPKTFNVITTKYSNRTATTSHGLLSILQVNIYSNNNIICCTYLLPPTALSFMCSAVMPISLHRTATSCAANMAAYGDAFCITTLVVVLHMAIAHLITICLHLHATSHTTYCFPTHMYRYTGGLDTITVTYFPDKSVT